MSLRVKGGIFCKSCRANRKLYKENGVFIPLCSPCGKKAYRKYMRKYLAKPGIRVQARKYNTAYQRTYRAKLKREAAA